MYLDLISNLSYAQRLLLSMFPRTLSLTLKRTKALFSPWWEDTAQKDNVHYHYKHKETIPQLLTENNVENFIYVSSIEQNNK